MNNENNKMNNNKVYKKWWLWVVVVILLVVGGWYVSGYLEFNGEQRGLDVESITDEMVMNMYEKQQKELEDKYKNDQYGGDTPEETIQLFIDALSNEDVELASKYFVVEKQGEMLDELSIGKNNDTLSGFVDILERKKIGEYYPDSNTQYVLTTFDENNIAEFSFDFILNPFTNKWKLSEI